jgi:hypothetical protein
LEALEERVLLDGTLALSAAAYSVIKGNTATIAVTRTGGMTGTLQVDYAVTPGTATAGVNYAGILPRPDLSDPGNRLTGTLTWVDGDSATKTFRIRALDDYHTDPALTANITLSNLLGSGTLGTSAAVLTINDFQPGRPQFSSSTYTHTSSGGSVLVTVNRVGGSSGVLTVPYSTIDGTAVAGQNYTAVSGTLTWADRDAAPKTFTVPLLNQSVGPTGKSFQVSLGQTGLDASRALVPSMWYNFDNHTANDGIIEDRGPNHLNLVNSQYDGAGGHAHYGPDLGPFQDNLGGGIVVSHFVPSGATFPGAGSAYNLEGGLHRDYNPPASPFTGTVTETVDDYFSYRDNMGVLPAGVTPDFSGSSSRNNNPVWYTNSIMDSHDGSISYSFWLELPELIGSDFNPARYFANFANREMLLGRESNPTNNPVGGVQGGGGGGFGGQVAVRTIPNYTQDPSYDPLDPLHTVKYTLELRSSGITIPTHVTFHVGEWNQFVVEYTPTATLVYQNGVLEDTLTTGTYDSSLQSIGEITGAMRLNQTAFWNTSRKEEGTFNIDDLGLWQGQISAADVQKLYTQGIGNAVMNTAPVNLIDAQILTVTSLADSGPGSLRAAILASVAGDTIHFANALAGGTISLSGGPLEISHDLTIQGPASGTVTIDAHNNSRIFVLDSGVNAMVSGLALTHGFARVTPSDNGAGGAFLDNGTLTLNNVNFLSNTSLAGGGAIAYVVPGGSSGTFALTVTNCTFTGNAGANGGAIYAVGGPNGGTFAISVTGSTFTDNVATRALSVGGYGSDSGFGGAFGTLLGPTGDAACTVSISDSTFTGNHANYGGAIASVIRLTSGTGSATYTLERVTATGNTAVRGGGFYNELQDTSTASINETIDHSTFDNNATTGVSVMDGTTTRLVSGDGAGVAVSALAGTGMTVLFTNDTLANNSAGVSGTDAMETANGGGFYLEAVNGATPAVSLSHLTIAYNDAQTAGGGLFTNYSALTTQDTLYGNNTTPGTGADVNGTVTSLGNNLLSSSAGGSGWIGSDLLDVDPRLSTLRNNGDPTKTIALLADSPAIGTGSSGTNIGATQYVASVAAQVQILLPPFITAGAPFDLTIAVLDQYGNLVDNYTGTLQFTLTGPLSLMRNFTFASTDMGQHTFTGVMVFTPGDYTLSGTDLDTMTFTGSTTFSVV